MYKLPQLLDLIDSYSKENHFPELPPELYEPCTYILTLGGKRLRPALVLMGNELFGEITDATCSTAWAVELFHNFSLMHDDIMDVAPLRRGKPTVHQKWNTTTAILSGDVMLIYAYRFLARSGNADKVIKLLDIFNRVATGVCEGQQMDVNFETIEEVSIPEYLKMIELKTAVLLGGALEMGAVCANAPMADTRHLYEFGRLAGISFQIQDDLLDTYGDPQKFGKQTGGDILQNKKTFLVLKTLEVAPETDVYVLRQWMLNNQGNPDEKIAAVRAIFDRNGIYELVSIEKQRYQQAAFQHLDLVQVPESRKSVLRKTVSDLLDRAY